MASKSAHMQLVNHSLDKRARERQIALPIVSIGIGYDALHRHGEHCRRAAPQPERSYVSGRATASP